MNPEGGEIIGKSSDVIRFSGSGPIVIGVDDAVFVEVDGQIGVEPFLGGYRRRDQHGGDESEIELMRNGRRVFV